MNKWIAILLVSALLLAAEAKSVGGPGDPLSLPADAEGDDVYGAGPLYLDNGEDVDGALRQRTARGTRASSEASFWKLLNLYRFHPGASFGWCHWPVSVRPASCFRNGVRPGTPVRM